MRLKITHHSEYNYDAPSQYALLRLRLTPKTRAGQNVVDWQVKLEGAVEEVSYRDHHNNQVELISVIPGTTRVAVTSSGEVDTEDRSGVIGQHGGFAPLSLFLRQTELTRNNRALRSLANDMGDGVGVETMHKLMALIAERVEYQPGETHSGTTAAEALKAGKGVCQDHSHIFVSTARIAGIPARYVSGFLLMEGQTQQFASHAWAEVWIKDLGWVGFDVSNSISPDARYVCVATGLDYRDAAPISGIRHGFATETLAVSVHVEQ